MTPPPLAIVQARMGSTRLPGKMLLDLGGKPLVLWATDAAITAFGRENVVAAIPASKENDELADVFMGRRVGVFRWGGPEDDVLGRLHACAHRYRWHPNAVVVRVTPDDPLKSAHTMQIVASGERRAVELGGEAFTLAMLDHAHKTIPFNHMSREHVTLALFPTAPPPPPPGVWTVDTSKDYEAVAARIAAAPTPKSRLTGDLHDPQMGELQR